MDEKSARPTPAEMAKLVVKFCESHGYRIDIVAVGKRSGFPSPAIDVVADTHYIDIAYIEIKNGTITQS